MYFSSVRIHNFKAIQDMTLQFKPGVNLLIGDNGVGKTSILEALAVGLGGYLSGITGVSSKNILQTDVRISSSTIAGASSAIAYMTPVEIACEVNINGNQFSWTRMREDESGESKTKTVNPPKTTVPHRTISLYAKEIANDVDSTLPLLSYLSTTRISLSKRGDFGSGLKKKLNDRRCGYIGCLDSSLDIKAIKAWCLKMELEAFQQERPIPEYEAFKKLVSSAMKKMSDLDSYPEIAYSRKFEDIVYNEGGQTLPISYLSAGYQSLLWMTMDIAHRMALLNPGRSDLGHTHGIVMIDELDMHLHPKWQWNVLTALEETFPNIQFIIATHSSILISSCKNEHLIRIDDQQEITYLDAAYAYSIEDVVEFVQGSSRIPQLAKELSHKFEYALNCDDTKNAREILQMMIDEYGLDNSEVKIAMTELDLVASDFSEDK